jgi:hypothetical protein
LTNDAIVNPAVDQAYRRPFAGGQNGTPNMTYLPVYYNWESRAKPLRLGQVPMLAA